MGKQKIAIFLDILPSAKLRVIIPDFVLVDAWYSSLDNLECISSFGWNWVAGIRKNRKVNCSDIIENLDIPDGGLRCYLRG